MSQVAHGIQINLHLTGKSRIILNFLCNLLNRVKGSISVTTLITLVTSLIIIFIYSGLWTCNILNNLTALGKHEARKFM